MFVKGGTTVYGGAMRGSVPPTMRIGELAAKVGVSTHVLRAWESRYGLLRPVRSAGGYRLYGHEDERRVREVVALRDQGVSAAEASRRVLATERAGGRIRYLGPDTPIHSLAAAARLTQADAVVLACRRPTGFRGHASALRRLSEDHPVWIAGRGATPRVLEEVGVPHLGGDLLAAVTGLTATARERRAQRPRSRSATVTEPSGAEGGAEPTA